MIDNLKKIGTDRLRIAEEEPYEVEYFARKHQLLPEHARNIIRRAGGSRKQADEIAAREKLRPLDLKRHPFGGSISK